MNFSLSSRSKSPILLAFIFSFIYWAYLFSSTTMEVKFDSLGYEDLGRMIAKEGWQEFFRTGPNREPLYPWLISLSMNIADRLSLHYTTIQKIFQIGILFTTQMLILVLLKKMNIDARLMALTILYLGISPAMINATFSLFSEILTFPLILSIIIISARSWREISSSSILKVLLLAVILALLFLLLISVKAIFEIVLPVFLLPFLYLSFRRFLDGNKRAALKIISFLCSVLLIVNAGTGMYKSINKKYNGNYILTDRGSWMIYASIERRAQPISSRGFLVYLATIPGERVCHSLFSQNDCYFWSTEMDSLIGANKGIELRKKGASNKENNDESLRLAKARIIQNPFRHIFFVALEGLKMFFWESTQIGYVTYPKWLKTLYNITLFKNILRLAIFILSLTAFLFTFYRIIKKRHMLTDLSSSSSEPIQISFFMLLMITLTTALYALVNILTRFSFPLVPLYLVLCAYFFQNISFKKSSRKS